ncbi:MAG: hypothetical protein ACTHY4_09990 [Flavobacteriaceae bacterium]|nr:hypothetical protein [Psychroflexus sp.]
MRYLYLLFIILSVQLHAQNRVLIQGQVNVPKDELSSMIEVVNLNSKTGTLTDAQGKFEMRVTENDRLRLDGMQYETFTVIIDQGILRSKQIIIDIKYGRNELEEIVVRPYNLNGNIAVDLERVNTYSVEANIPSTRKVLQSYHAANPSTPNLTVAENPTETRIVKNGLNVANLFRALVKDDFLKKKNKSVNRKYLNALYKDDFFKDQLGIKEDKINAFVEYVVQSDGFSDQLLTKKNELDLVRFLMEKAESFKK